MERGRTLPIIATRTKRMLEMSLSQQEALNSAVQPRSVQPQRRSSITPIKKTRYAPKRQLSSCVAEIEGNETQSAKAVSRDPRETNEKIGLF